MELVEQLMILNTALSIVVVVLFSLFVYYQYKSEQNREMAKEYYFKYEDLKREYAILKRLCEHYECWHEGSED